jgi:hypothetical protein
MDLLLEEEILRLYREPLIGASNNNSYGEENIRNLVNKFRTLGREETEAMVGWLTLYSTSPDLAASYVSVGVLHGLGRKPEVEAAYAWARGLADGARIISHFDIGVALAEHFVLKD